MTKNPQNTAAQLRRPHGPLAEEVAEQMNKAHERTNLKAIAALEILNNDRVLEIGPGNGKFVSSVISQAVGVKYVGLDWSEKMVAAARKLNTPLVEAGRAVFELGTSSRIPFQDEAFDKALAVHTIYFWEEPHSHLLELKRVLVPGGKFCLCFGDKSFMEQLPFSQYGFRLYDKERAEEQLLASGFTILHTLKHLEHGESNTGDMVEKLIYILVCTA